MDERLLRVAPLIEDSSSDAPSAVLVLYSIQPAEKAEHLLDLLQEAHHATWSYGRGIVAECELFPSSASDELLMLTGKRGKRQLSAVSGIGVEAREPSGEDEPPGHLLLEQLLASSIAAAFRRLLMVVESEADSDPIAPLAPPKVTVGFTDSQRQLSFTV